MGAGTFSSRVRLNRLPRSRPHIFSEEPDAEARAAIASALDLRGLPKFRFDGQLVPMEDDGWRLEAELGASAVQSCVITLAPVKTRIDTPVRRIYRADTGVAASEVDIDPEEADEIEPLVDVLDLGAVAVEALSLALPDYPKAEGATLEGFGGDAPDEDEKVKPFAGLAALKARMESPEE